MSIVSSFSGFIAVIGLTWILAPSQQEPQNEWCTPDKCTALATAPTFGPIAQLLVIQQTQSPGECGCDGFVCVETAACLAVMKVQITGGTISQVIPIVNPQPQWRNWHVATATVTSCGDVDLQSYSVVNPPGGAFGNGGCDVKAECGSCTWYCL